MDDLISRAAAIDAIVSVTAFPDADYIKNLCQNPANSEDWLGGVCDAINAVEDVNAVDAAPVIHARSVWINPFDPVAKICTWKCSRLCSACGDYMAVAWKYCPNCGARMDGEADG